MLRARYLSLFAISILLVFPGCATTSPQISPMQMRQFTSRNVEGNYEDVFRATMTVLQDQGYIIKNTDMASGLIVAQVDRETSTGSQFMQVVWAGYVWDKGTVVEVSATVNKLSAMAAEIRMNIQEVNYGQYNNKNTIKTITDPGVYDSILNDIVVEVRRREAVNPDSVAMAQPVPLPMPPATKPAASTVVPSEDDKQLVSQAFDSV